ncbi:hypothetical protein Tco_0044222 [Tanacetum coccineum]
MDRKIRRDPERDVGYGITDSWDEIVETLQGAPVSTDTELGRHMIAFETRVRQDTYEIYTRLSAQHVEIEATYRGTGADKETSDLDGRVRETTGTRQRSCTARATGGGW